MRQSEEALNLATAKLKTGLGGLSDVAQARVTYTQFKANLVAAEANVLTQEDVLRNLLGLPPDDGRKIVPVSAPTTERLKPQWGPLVQLAEQRRPDIVELKLITEADQQRLIQAKDQTKPKLNAVASYTWDGLSGEMPNGEEISTHGGQYTNWSVGVNFSVPLGLRQGRAQVRQTGTRHRPRPGQRGAGSPRRPARPGGRRARPGQRLRPVSRLQGGSPGCHGQPAHPVRPVPARARPSRARPAIYLNVLQALNDWGNAVSSEAQQLLAYNTALANLERQTGTILETHGLVFYEERFRAAGPLGMVCGARLYSWATVPAGEPHRYPGTSEPSENAFDLKNPVAPNEKPPEKLPPPAAPNP